MAISSNKFFGGEIFVYKYISKNMINFYNSIIDDILFKVLYNDSHDNALNKIDINPTISRLYNKCNIQVSLKVNRE